MLNNSKIVALQLQGRSLWVSSWYIRFAMEEPGNLGDLYYKEQWRLTQIASYYNWQDQAKLRGLYNTQGEENVS